MTPKEAIAISRNIFADASTIHFRGTDYFRREFGKLLPKLRGFSVTTKGRKGETIQIQCIEQNLLKDSAPAARGRAGAKITWFIPPQGSWYRVEDGKFFKGNSEVPIYSP